MATAGRTVMFSGLTVAAAMSSLLVFPQGFLRSMGYGGIAAVVSGDAGRADRAAGQAPAAPGQAVDAGRMPVAARAAPRPPTVGGGRRWRTR